MQKISFSCVVVIFFLKCHINTLSIFYPSYYYVAYSCGIWIHERKGIFSYRYIFLLFIKVIYNSNLFIYYLYIVILLIFYCGVLFCLTVWSEKYPWIFFEETLFECVIYSTIDHWILSFEVSKPSWILEAASPLLVLIKPNFPFFLCSTISKHFIFMHTLLISQPLHLFPRVNKFAIVQAIQIIASPLCSSDALLTSNPKEPCPRHHGNQSRMHLGPFVSSHLIENCMYLVIDMRLYQI